MDLQYFHFISYTAEHEQFEISAHHWPIKLRQLQSVFFFFTYTITYYTVSLFIEQKLNQNTETVCEKLSEPLPQEL